MAIWVGISISSMPIHNQSEMFDPKINPDRWMTGFKPQRGEIFGVKEDPLYEPAQRRRRDEETEGLRDGGTEGRRD